MKTESVYIKAPPKMWKGRADSEKYAAAEFGYWEIFIIRAALKDNSDNSDRICYDMKKQLKAAQEGTACREKRGYAEKYCGVRFNGDKARIRLSRCQYNMMCIAVLSRADSLRYMEADRPDILTDVQDKLIRIMDGFRSGDMVMIADDELNVIYE